MTHTFTVQLSQKGPWYVASTPGVVGGWEIRQGNQVDRKVREGLALLHRISTSDVQVNWQYDASVRQVA